MLGLELLTYRDVHNGNFVKKAIDHIGQPSPQTIAFEWHFYIDGLVWGRQMLADLLEIGFDAKIPQGSRFPVEKRHANGCLVLAFGWFHG